MSVESESLQMLMSSMSTMVQTGRSLTEAAEQLITNLIRVINFGREVHNKRLRGEVSFNKLIKNNEEVGFLFLKDGATLEENKKLIKEFKEDLTKAGVVFATTKFDPEVNGIPSSFAFRECDRAKVQMVMNLDKYKKLGEFNPSPSKEDFDDKTVDSATRDEYLKKVENKTETDVGDTDNSKPNGTPKSKKMFSRENGQGGFKGLTENYVKEAAEKAKNKLNLDRQKKNRD